MRAHGRAFVNAATRPQSLTDPAQGGLTRDQLARFATILWPFAPHIADEIGAKLGISGTTHEGMRVSLANEPWPAVDPTKLVDDEVEMPVQIQGKIKARLMVPAKADAASIEALALAHADVVAAIAGRAVKKVVVVPGRMVNIVV